jgi:hypothetical protein
MLGPVGQGQDGAFFKGKRRQRARTLQQERGHRAQMRLVAHNGDVLGGAGNPCDRSPRIGFGFEVRTLEERNRKIEPHGQQARGFTGADKAAAPDLARTEGSAAAEMAHEPGDLRTAALAERPPRILLGRDGMSVADEIKLHRKNEAQGKNPARGRENFAIAGG